MKYKSQRQEMCDVARLMFDRKLTNIAGGNISMKIDENTFLLTPSLMSEEKHCRITPDEILVIDRDMNVIDGEGKVTRECNMHMGIYKNLPLSGVVLHAHPKETLVFSCTGIPMPRLYEGADKFGEIITLEYAPSCSQQLADNAVNYFKNRNDELNKRTIVTLLRRHGILIVDKSSLSKALDALERVETNAYIAVQAKSLGYEF